MTTREGAYPYPGKQYILSVDRYQIEVMDHLDELPATGAVIFCTFPKVRDGVGYPPACLCGLPRSVASRQTFLFYNSRRDAFNGLNSKKPPQRALPFWRFSCSAMANRHFRNS